VYHITAVEIMTPNTIKYFRSVFVPTVAKSFAFSNLYNLNDIFVANKVFILFAMFLVNNPQYSVTSILDDSFHFSTLLHIVVDKPCTNW
jgi:hypothetical protein